MWIDDGDYIKITAIGIYSITGISDSKFCSYDNLDTTELFDPMIIIHKK